MTYPRNNGQQGTEEKVGGGGHTLDKTGLIKASNIFLMKPGKWWIRSSEIFGWTLMNCPEFIAPDLAYPDSIIGVVEPSRPPIASIEDALPPPRKYVILTSDLKILGEVWLYFRRTHINWAWLFFGDSISNLSLPPLYILTSWRTHRN